MQNQVHTGIVVPKYGTIETRHKWYVRNAKVRSLLRQIGCDGCDTDSVEDWSDSSSGKKIYWVLVGAELDALNDIWEDFLKSIADAVPYVHSDYALAMAVPKPADIVSRLLGRDVECRFDGRDDYPSKADYLAMCDEAIALSGATVLALAA